MQWATIEQLVLAGDHRLLTAALLQLDAAERKEFVAPLKALVRLPAGEWHSAGRGSMFLLTGAAVLPNASALAPWLRRWNYTYWVRRPGGDLYDNETFDVTADLQRILLARELPWLADLAARMAQRLPTTRADFHHQQVVEWLLEQTGAPPPDTDGYLVGVVTERRRAGGFLERARADPRLAALTPRLFELDAVATVLVGGEPGVDVVTTLVREGAVDRTAVLDAAVARLQRPGRPGVVAAFTTIFENLAPTLDELAARTRDLLAAVAGATPALVGLLQRHLHALAGAGRLGRAEQLEASGLLLARPEKKVVRAELAHLTALGDADPSFAGAAAATVATTFAQAAVDLQRAAADLLVRWVAALDAGARAAVVAAAVDLPSDLRRRVEDAFGAAVPSDDVAVVLPPAPRPERVRPLAAPTALVERVLGLVQASARTDPVDLELVLEGLVRWAVVRDEVDLRAVLRPVLESNAYVHWVRADTFDGRRPEQLAYAVLRVLAAAVGDPVWERRPPGRRETALHTLVLDRVDQLADDLAARPGPRLVSWPSTTTGSITPVDLLDRLRVAAAEGWEPWDDDLATALLRVDRDAPADLDAFTALGTTAGDRVATSLAAGPLRATTRAVWCERSVSPGVWVTYSVDGRPTDPDAGPPVEIVQNLLAAVDAGPDASSVPGWSRLVPFDPAAVDRAPRWSATVPRVWVAALPGHRDVVAAHLADTFRSGTTATNDAAGAVLALAEAAGPVGDGLFLVLAYALGASETAARADAADALLVLAARGGLDTTRLGDMIGALCSEGELVVARTLGPLRDAAVSGAAAFLWPAVSALVSALAGADDPGPKFADVLALAAEIAELAGATDVPLGLDRLAARTGRSRTVTEARRLRTVLGGGRGGDGGSGRAEPAPAGSGPARFDGDVTVADGVLLVDSGVGGPDERYGRPGGPQGLVDATQPGLLVVRTGAVDGLVRLRVEVVDAPPPVDTDADEVVEVSCDLRGPALRIGPPDQAVAIDVLCNGPHRARWTVRGLEAGRDHPRRTPTDRVHERWLLHLWPAPAAPDAVVLTTTATAAHRHRDASLRPSSPTTVQDLAAADRVTSERERARARAERLRHWGGREPTPRLRAIESAVVPLVHAGRRDLVDRIAAASPDVQRRLAVDVARRACARDDGPVDWDPALAALADATPLPPPFDDPAAVHSLMFGPQTGFTTSFVVARIGGVPPPRQALHAGVAADAAVRAATDPDPLVAALRAVEAASWSAPDLDDWYDEVDRSLADGSR